MTVYSKVMEKLTDSNGCYIAIGKLKLLEIASCSRDDKSLVGSSISNGEADHNSVDKSSSDDLDSSCSIDLSEWTRKLNTIGNFQSKILRKNISAIS